MPRLPDGRLPLAGGMPMNIVVIGRGNVGRGLTELWRKAGHEVTALGRRGGDPSDAGVVVAAGPRPAISAAFGCGG